MARLNKMIDPAEPVVFREHFNLETGPGLTAEKVPDIVFRQDNGPFVCSKVQGS